MKSVLFVTDAWLPQVNGVVRTLENTIAALDRAGIRARVLGSDGFTTLPCPTYPEIRLSLTTRQHVARRMAELGGEHLHIATEGPLGLLAGAAARRAGRAFSTSYHTRFPEYVSARMPLPTGPFYRWFRRFHNAGQGCMVATPGLRDDLAARGFRNLTLWPRGVDTALFRPIAGDGPYAGLERPIWLNVGRISVEKNLRAFLDLDLPGTKVVVGDGPQLGALRRAYPAVRFTGAKSSDALARHYAAADAFVFPSRTDTFGMVLLEAMASGLPVAAFPVMGPVDVIEHGRTGMLSTDLRQAALGALNLARPVCRAAALERTWDACTAQFLHNARMAEARLGVGQTA